MTPYDVLERAADVRNRVVERPKISVTELSRNKEWRTTLPKAGVIEITDHGSTAGWLLSPGDMAAIVEGYTQLEEEMERIQIAEILKVRHKSEPFMGELLKTAVQKQWGTRKDAIKDAIDAN